jgi:hypothetical protein
MIRADHARVRALFHRYHVYDDWHRKQAIADAVGKSLEVPAKLEKEIFYPMMREMGIDTDIVDKSFPAYD